RQPPDPALSSHGGKGGVRGNGRHDLPTGDIAMISVVIPVCNEKESLGVLLGEIAEVARQAEVDLEVLFVDDGSRDGSWTVITDLARNHDCVHGIRLRRNFGKAAALSAGFHTARGDLILTMDADLQDDPKEIPA